MATTKQLKGKQPKHAKELAQRTRAAILLGMDAVQKRGEKKLMSEILADAFIENPLKFLDTASKYLPKDINMDVTHTKSAQALTDDELADIIAQRARARLEDSKEVEGEVIENTEDNQTLTG